MESVIRVRSEDGLEIHTEAHGPISGEPVVLLHGWPDSAALWRRQVPALADAGHRVIVVDQRGFGRSDRPAELSGYHVFHAMSDLSEVLDSHEIEQAHLVGHDWGAVPCWLLAMFAPERVKSLTPISVGHPTAFRRAGLEQKRRSFYMLLFQFEGIAETWLTADDWSNLRDLAGRTTEWTLWMDRLAEPGALTASLGWYRANSAPDTLVEPPTDLPPVTRPTLGIIGSDDPLLGTTQMEESGRYISAEWRYESLDGVAHWVPTEAAERLNGLLLEWFRDHS